MDIPFRLSNSAEDADPDARLMVSSLSRRLHGHVVLADDTLVFEIDATSSGVRNSATRSATSRAAPPRGAAPKAGAPRRGARVWFPNRSAS